MEKYIEGYNLKENEYLCKIQTYIYHDGTEDKKGFITKFNQNGSMPVKFKEWGGYYRNSIWNPKPEIFILEEVFSKGWKIEFARIGQSQEWATMIHPLGFTLEIYLSNLFELIKNNTIINGELQGEFKWHSSKKLIKKLN